MSAAAYPPGHTPARSVHSDGARIGGDSGGLPASTPTFMAGAACRCALAAAFFSFAAASALSLADGLGLTSFGCFEVPARDLDFAFPRAFVVAREAGMVTRQSLDAARTRCFRHGFRATCILLD